MKFYSHNFSISFIFSMLLLMSCNEENNADDDYADVGLINYLHSSFNQEELRPEVIDNSGLVKIVTFGHIHSTHEFEDLMTLFFEEVKKENPDYVFILGDIVFYNNDSEWRVIQNRINNLNCKVLYVPGNHDINYYDEREQGIYNKQWEAEGRYLQKTGYRYKLLKDNVANYLFLNLNDSLARINEYINKIESSIDTTKKTFVFTHHDLWAQKVASKDDPKSWTSKLFNGNDLITKLEDFDVFVNGDWNLEYAEKKRFFAGKNHTTISVGSRMKGDPLGYTVIELTDSSMSFTPKQISIPRYHDWFKKPNK